MKLTIRELVIALAEFPADTEIRIGDVSEADDLHCSVGKIVDRGGCIILIHGDEGLWKDETLASTILSQQVWPEEDVSED